MQMDQRVRSEQDTGVGEEGQRGDKLIGEGQPRQRGLGRTLMWVTVILMLTAAVVIVVAFEPLSFFSRVEMPLVELPTISNIGQGTNSSTNCIACHNYPNPEAQIWVAVNGNEVTRGASIEMRAGDSFEVDFHFTNMLGSPKKFMAVGMEVVVPPKPLWRVGTGTYNYPKAWSPQGSGRNLWSPKWDRSTNGDAGDFAKWSASQDMPGAYYLALSGAPFSLPAEVVHGAVEADRGLDDPSDRDGVANHAGGDLVIGVPPNTPPGNYKVTIYPVGHDLKDRPANTSFSFTVAVAGTSSDGQGGMLEPSSGSTVYAQRCSGCHGRTLADQEAQKVKARSSEELRAFVAKGSEKMPAQGSKAGGKLNDDEIAAAVEYMQRLAKKEPRKLGPMMQHGLAGREGLCLQCHRQGGEAKPPGAGHVGYTSGACVVCHSAPPRMPHPLEGRAACNSCHRVP